MTGNVLAQVVGHEPCIDVVGASRRIGHDELDGSLVVELRAALRSRALHAADSEHGNQRANPNHICHDAPLRHLRVPAIRPPSMVTALPLVKEERSEARNATVSATSSTVAARPPGILACSSCQRL